MKIYIYLTIFFKFLISIIITLQIYSFFFLGKAIKMTDDRLKTWYTKCKLNSVFKTAELQYIGDVSNFMIQEPVLQMYRMFSLSKPITAAILLALFDEKNLSLQTPVHFFLGDKWKKENMRVFVLKNNKPSFVAVLNDITIHHLLTHTSGLGYGFKNSGGCSFQFEEYAAKNLSINKVFLLQTGDVGCETLEQAICVLPECMLAFQPGTGVQYSYSFDVIGLVIEKITSKSLDDSLQHFICSKLGMKNTHFVIDEPSNISNVAPVYVQFAGSLIDLKIYYPDYALGGSSLYSTLTDYSNFLSMMVNKGLFKGVRVLCESSVTAMTKNQLLKENKSVSIFELNPRFDTIQNIESFGIGYGAFVCISNNKIGDVGDYLIGSAFKSVFKINIENSQLLLLITSTVYSKNQMNFIAELISLLKNTEYVDTRKYSGGFKKNLFLTVTYLIRKYVSISRDRKSVLKKRILSKKNQNTSILVSKLF
jgi:CubicO group peptidase (beta-lactamase class C family)